MNAQGSGVHWAYGARRVWHVARWVLLALIVLYIALIIYRIPAVQEKERSQQMVAQIQAQKLTMDAVDGNHLPPPPNPNQVNTTIAGIDANGNGIRDDVELAIFEKYPGKANEKIRAAELQYAMELQVELTGSVFDNATWKANAVEEDRGYQCIAMTVPKNNLRVHINVVDQRTAEVESFVFNTDDRKKRQREVAKFETSFMLPNKYFCDLLI